MSDKGSTYAVSNQTFSKRNTKLNSDLTGRYLFGTRLSKLIETSERNVVIGDLA